jgi:hypothetical protein
MGASAGVGCTTTSPRIATGDHASPAALSDLPSSNSERMELLSRSMLETRPRCETSASVRLVAGEI